MTAEAFAVAALTYCRRTRASITSWYRTTEHNRLVGGVANSPHLLGLAVDVVYDPAGSLELRAELARQLELHRIVEKDHDHLQPADWLP